MSWLWQQLKLLSAKSNGVSTKEEESKVKSELKTEPESNNAEGAVSGDAAAAAAAPTHVKKEEGQSFIDWLVSPAGQKAIADYKIAGQQLFFPNADVPGA